MVNVTINIPYIHGSVMGTNVVFRIRLILWGFTELDPKQWIQTQRHWEATANPSLNPRKNPHIFMWELHDRTTILVPHEQNARSGGKASERLQCWRPQFEKKEVFLTFLRVSGYTLPYWAVSNRCVVFLKNHRTWSKWWLVIPWYFSDLLSKVT